MRRTVVVGAGLSGLLSAVDRRRCGDDVLVLESSAQPGGVAGAVERDGYRLPTAVSTLRLPDPVLDPILGFAGIETVSAPTTRRFIADGRLRPLVPGPGLITTDLVSIRGKVRALLEPVLGRSAGDDSSVSDVMRARFGREVGDLAATLMTRGVFAGDPEALSATAAFPGIGSGSMLGAVGRRSGRRHSRVPVGGMGSLIERLVSAAGEVRLATEVVSVSRYGNRWRVETTSETEIADRVILAVSPPVAQAILSEPGPMGERWRPLPVAVVGLAGSREDMGYPSGFGFLTGPNHGGPVLGGVFESDIDPSSAPPGRRLLRVLAGGALDPDLTDQDDGTIVDKVASDLGRATAIDIQPDLTMVVRQEPGIPQYGHGHTKWLNGVRQWVRRYPGLGLAGWGYAGVGVGSLIRATSTEDTT